MLSHQELMNEIKKRNADEIATIIEDSSKFLRQQKESKKGSTYTGSLDSSGNFVVTVSKNGIEQPLRMSDFAVEVSPGGFAWGYSGQGHRALAHSILVNEFDLLVAYKYAPSFEEEVVKKELLLGAERTPGVKWQITSEEIRLWHQTARPEELWGALQHASELANEPSLESELKLGREKQAVFTGKSWGVNKYSVVVSEAGVEVPLRMSDYAVQKSPTGYNWGFLGAGSIALAHSILTWQFGTNIADKYSTFFLADVLRNLPKEKTDISDVIWQLSSAEINNWLTQTMSTLISEYDSSADDPTDYLLAKYGR